MTYICCHLSTEHTVWSELTLHNPLPVKRATKCDRIDRVKSCELRSKTPVCHTHEVSLGVHGGGEGRGHSVSPRAQLVQYGLIIELCEHNSLQTAHTSRLRRSTDQRRSLSRELFVPQQTTARAHGKHAIRTHTYAVVRCIEP